MSILVINAGSSSLKFALFNSSADKLQLSGTIDWASGNRRQAKCAVFKPGSGEIVSLAAVPDDRSAVACAIQCLGDQCAISAIGHRVVYGGSEFRGSTLVDENVKTTIARLSELAPLHNPPALAAIQATETLLPGVPQVAVFDTAFFVSLPPRSYLYPVPFEWHEKWGVRRIGFHGISNAYCANRAAEMLGGNPARLRLVTCHLGGGCSATAVQGGAPVATTMGFTPMEGLMMGTRSGSVDPGLMLYLLRRCGLTTDELDSALNHQSGLLGVSGLSRNIGELESAAQAGHQRAQLALEMFADRVRSTVGALAVAMGGIDAVVFTARIGERSTALRETICKGLECLGLNLDTARNASAEPDADVATADSPGRILVIQTQEELVIARETRSVCC